MTTGPAARTACALLSNLMWIFHLQVAAAYPHSTDPSSQAKPNITFYIHSTPDDSPIINDFKTLDQTQPITMVIHGFKGDHTARSMESIRHALLLTGVPNVVVMDWGPMADAAHESALDAYHHVRDHGVTAAADLGAQWMREVMNHTNISPEHFHLIGFSLGAHVAGVIGQHFNSSLGRISALDPPHFGYEHSGKEIRLDVTDAQFVNVIHTSAGILSYTDPIGHADFYPNGDIVPQNGCPHHNPIDIITCSHYFSFALFAESIYNNNAFVGTECSSWKKFTHGSCKNNTKMVMGYSTPNTARGVFYLKTKDKPPFGEENEKSPMPTKLLQLLEYTKNDSVLNSKDVVNFLMHKDPSQRAAGDDPDVLKSLESLEGSLNSDDHKKVMRVKTTHHASTTPNPPAFLDNLASAVQSSKIIITIFAGLSILRIYCISC